MQILRYQHYERTNEWTDERTDERTDKSEFIGPFRLKPWVQKKKNYSGNQKLLFLFPHKEFLIKSLIN